MKKAWKKLFVPLTAFLLVLGVAAGGVRVQADSPYRTYTIDGYGYVTETQTAYLPYETITKIGDEALIGPTDLTLTEDGYMYILDSGNGRVVVSDMDANLIDTFGEGILVAPRGMYVTKDRICYVADRDARSIFVFDAAGELIQT